MSQSNTSQSSQSDAFQSDPETPVSGVRFSLPGIEPAYVEGWKQVGDLGELLDDHRLIAELGYLSGITSDHLPYEQTAAIEVSVVVKLSGETDLRTVLIKEPTLAHLRSQMQATGPGFSVDSPMNIVTLLLRRFRRRND